MASRYWVGGTGTWSGAGTGNWSATSGGASGASVPGSSDDVFFDAASGAGTCTMSTSATIASISFAGSAITTFAQDTNTITVVGAGGVTLNSGVTYTGAGVFTLNAGAATISMNFDGAGATIAAEIRLATNGGGALTVTLTGAITTTNSTGVRLISSSGTGALDTAGLAVTTPALSTGGANDTLTLGASTVTVTGNGTCWSMNASTTFSGASSTIILNDASSSTKTFAGAGKTYGTVEFAGAGTGRFDITGSNTIATFTVSSPPHEVRFTAGTTTTITTSFDGASGTSGNLNTLRSSSNGSAWNLSKSSGTVTVQYALISDSAAAGGAEFLAPLSVDVGGNSGWKFDAVGFFGFGRVLPF